MQHFQNLLFNDPQLSQLRWIVLPSEVKEHLLAPNKVKPARITPFTPKMYSSVGSKTEQSVGSYLGENSRFDWSSIGQANPFVLKNWFDKSAPEKSKNTQVIQSEHKENIKNPIETCPVENGIVMCILPEGRRPDPPQPLKVKSRWRPPNKDIFRPFLEAVEKFEMIKDGDRVLVCLSGGKDSLSLLHTMRQYQV